MYSRYLSDLMYSKYPLYPFSVSSNVVYKVTKMGTLSTDEYAEAFVLIITLFYWVKRLILPLST